MVDLSHKHCEHPDGCSTPSRFGLPGGSRTRCSLHKEPAMVNLSMKRCDHPGGCSKVPGYGLPGGLRTRCCAHKEPAVVYHPCVGSNPVNGPGAPHGSARLATTISSTGGGGTSCNGGTGGSCNGGAGGGQPAASPGRLPAADPTCSPSAADAALGIGERPRQDFPFPASVLGKQQAAGGQGSSRKRPSGMETPLLLQADLALPSVEGPAGVPPSGEEASLRAGAARTPFRGAAHGPDAKTTVPAAGPAAEGLFPTGRAQAGASSQHQAPHILLGGGPNKRYRHGALVRM